MYVQALWARMACFQAAKTMCKLSYNLVESRADEEGQAKEG
jgi:hypothetical protein